MKEETILEEFRKKCYVGTFITDLRDLLYKSSERFKKRNAFKLKDKNGKIYGVTYEQFRQDVEALGTSLLDLGLKDKAIAIMGKNSYPWAVSYMAATVVGVAVPIDRELHQEDVTNFLNISHASVFLADTKHIKQISSTLDQLENPQIQFINFDTEKSRKDVLAFSSVLEEGKESCSHGNTSFSDLEIDPDAMHVLLFTSGTTGKAKAVCLSHKNLCSNVRSAFGIIKLKSSDQLLSILPIHHTFECTLGFLLIMYSGGCIAFCDGLRYITKNIEEYHPNIILCVPLLLENVYKKIQKTLSTSLPKKYQIEGTNIYDNLPFLLKKIVRMKIKNSLGGRMKTFIVGAAAMNANIISDFFKYGINVYQGYGLTECSPLVAGNNDFFQNFESIGLPIPNVEVAISDPDDNGVGEIMVKGDNVMLGYYNNEEETNKVLKDGWFYTGDLGKMDKDGWIYITGRCKSIIVTKNGKKVYPEELEYYLDDNPLIAESLVTGFPHEDDVYVNAQIFPNIDAIKEYLKVSMVTKEEIYATVKEIVQEINKKLPNYKHIKEFIVRDEGFEKTTTQKIKRFGNNMKVAK